MRPGKIAIAGLVIASSLFAANVATAGPTDKATGGGQVLVGTKGAGDTIAFNARGTIAAAEGQVQYVDRTDGTGQGQVVSHGEVSCLDVMGNVAKIGGSWRDGGTFDIYVEDNGEGANAENDVVTVMPGDGTCEFDEPEDEDKVALARGNAQVHK